MPDGDVQDKIATLQARLDGLELRRARRQQREFLDRYVVLVLPGTVGLLIGAGAQVLALHLAMDQDQDPTSWLLSTVVVALVFVLVFFTAWLIQRHFAGGA